MPNDGDVKVSVTLEELAGQMATVMAENNRLSMRVAQLEGDGENESRPLPSASPQLLDTQSPHGAEEVIGDRPVSRRGAIMAMGAAAAGAAGVAVGSTILGAQPAAAADGDPMILGAGNAESKGMSVSNSGSGDAFAAVSIAGQNAFHGFVVNGPSFSQPQPASVSGETNQADTYGVYGGSTSADGVHAITTGNGQSGASGIDQSPTGGHGVYGRSENGTGVYGTGNVGVEGNTPDGIGVFGMGAPGVLGESNATSDTDFLGQAGVFGVGNQFGPGLQALNDEGASLFLGPYVSTTLPSPASPGQFIVLSNGSLWYCGVANKWVQLNKGFTNLLTTPIRVFDSRLSDNPADPSRPAGPAAAQSVTPLQITGTTVSGESVPAGVVAVVGNATVVNPSAGGWLTLYPAGGSTPLASNLNFQSGDVARANFCIVGLSAAGAIDVFAQVKTDFLFDVTGYVY